MSKVQVVETFPSIILRKDQFLYAAVVAVTSVVLTLGVFAAIKPYQPAGAEVYDWFFIMVIGFVVSVFAISFIGRNNRFCESNRLAFSQAARSSVRRKLNGAITLEQVQALRDGARIPQYGFTIWLEKRGNSFALMTDKVMGTVLKEDARYLKQY